MRTIVEGMLPSQVLLDLGTYLQTAAHGELTVWQIIMHAEGTDPNSVQDFQAAVGLKLRTSELVARFKACAGFCPPFIAARVRSVASTYADRLEVRNLAAHGAFFVEDQSEGKLGVCHYFTRGRGKDREVMQVDQTVSQHDVNEAIRLANELLDDLIALRQLVKVWRYPDGHPDNEDPPKRTDSSPKLQGPAE